MSNNSNSKFDIVVVGGGLAGLTAALALSSAGDHAAAQSPKIALIMPKPSRVDGRTTALLGKSVAYLEQLGIWQQCQDHAAPLSVMRIVDGTHRLWRAPPVSFKAVELDLEAFGYNVANSVLCEALLQKILEKGVVNLIEDSLVDIRFLDDRLNFHTANGRDFSAKLAIAADGKNSLTRQKANISVRKWQYPQVAIAVDFTHSRSHRDTSTEFHTEEGPFTVVPLPTLDGKYQSGLVWVMRPENAARFLTCDNASQQIQIETKMQSILGKITLCGVPQQFPLSGMVARSFANNRVALVGDAAHVFPPIGAQGFNLGLRDVREICKIAASALARNEDPGSPGNLTRYDHHRRRDITTRTGAVDLLNRSLLTDFLPVQAARGLGLFALSQIPLLRKFAMRKGMALDASENHSDAA